MQLHGVKISENEPLRSHTTFKIGGPARYYAVPECTEGIQNSIAFAEEKGLPYVVTGRGSNVLFSDEGYPGVVIEIGRGMEKVNLQGKNRICAEAGAGLGVLASEAAKNSLSGLEFASGIPGAVGGAVTMNAGAYGGEIRDCIVSASVLCPDGTVREMACDELELGYRSSRIQSGGYIVLEAVFELQPGDKDAILARMRELNARRREKQPLEYASAGSTFKRPEGHFAGKLIEDAGLRGYRVGDAQVSEKHCGFVINRGNATAADVLKLIGDVQERVLGFSVIRLETEVKIIAG